jgi:hypothetical protein
MLEAKANLLGVRAGGGGLGADGWDAKGMNGAVMGLPLPATTPAAATASAAAATAATAAAAAAAGAPGMPQLMASMQAMMMTPTLQVSRR